MEDKMFSAEVLALQAATLAARKRTGNEALSTCVERGLFQVNEVTYPKEKRGHSDVKPLSEMLPIQGAIAFLNGL